jgi:hypothetical protein
MKSTKAWAEKPIEIYLNVLGYKKEGEWIALALEMDIRGFGATFEEALKDMLELVKMQIGFAVFKKQPSMIFHPANPKYFLLYQELKDERIQRFGLENEEEEFAICGMPLPPPHLIAAQFKDHFQPSHG